MTPARTKRLNYYTPCWRRASLYLALVIVDLYIKVPILRARSSGLRFVCARAGRGGRKDVLEVW